MIRRKLPEDPRWCLRYLGIGSRSCFCGLDIAMKPMRSCMRRIISDGMNRMYRMVMTISCSRMCVVLFSILKSCSFAGVACSKSMYVLVVFVPGIGHGRFPLRLTSPAHRRRRARRMWSSFCVRSFAETSLAPLILREMENL